MADWISKLTGRTSSASEAKERLKLVLIHDRTDINPDVLEKLQEDLIQAISNHIRIDPHTVKIKIMHEGREQRLIADIPLKPHDGKITR